MLAVALDLGGTQTRAALVDAQGAILRRVAAATPATEGPDAVVALMGQLARQAMDGIAPAAIAGVGVSSAGPLDARAGIALAIPTLAGFVGVPLAAMLEQRIGLRVRLENDAIAAAIGEWRFGAGRGCDDLVYVTVSTGIGGGVIADGRVLRGRRGMAGHVGHMVVARDGTRCACGNPGCWEAYAAGPAFQRRAREQAAQRPDSALHPLAATLEGSDVFVHAEAGDALARALVAEEADWLGVGIVSLLHLYSPERVVLGGGVARNFAALLPGIAARVRSEAMPPFRDARVLPAALAGNSELVGAAALALGIAD